MRINPNLRLKKKCSQLISFSLAPTRSHQSQTSPRRYLSVLTSTTQPPKSSKSSETKKKRKRLITSLSFPLQTQKRRSRRSLQSQNPFHYLSFRSHPQAKTGPKQAKGSSSTTPSKNPNTTPLCSPKTSSTTNPSKRSPQTIPQSSSSTTPRSAARPSTAPNPSTTSTSSTPT